MDNQDIKYFHWKTIGLTIIVFLVTAFFETVIFAMDFKTAMFGSLVFSVLAYLVTITKNIVEMNSKFLKYYKDITEKLTGDIHNLWEMKARDVWGKPIGNGFANSDRIAIQYETLVKKFIEQFDGKPPGARGYIGHIFLQDYVHVSMYGRWIEGLIEDGLITEYETVNLFTPKEVLGDIDTKRVVESLRDLACRKKKRVHVLSPSKLHNMYTEWTETTPGSKSTEEFANYIISEYEQFDRDYAGTSPSCFETYHVFDEALMDRGKLLGEYVVINRRIALRYDQNTQLLEFILGEEPVKLYSLVFDEPSLKDIPPSDTNTEQRRNQLISYLNKIGIT